MLRFRNKYVFFLIAFCLLGVLSCTKRPKEVLSPSEMTNVLVDMHIVDGVLLTGGFRYTPENEKSYYYSYVLEKHHTTQAQFDSSLIWYTRNPKQFEKIYLKTIDKLTKRQADVMAGKYLTAENIALPASETLNLWKDSIRYMPTKDAPKAIDFVIKDSTLLSEDTYLLKFIYRIEPEDSCFNRRVDFRIHYADGRVDYMNRKLYSDGKLRRFALQLDAKHKMSIDSLSGVILANDSCNGKQRISVDSIALIRTYNPAVQDSIREALEYQDELMNSPHILFPFPDDKVNPFLFKKN